MFIKVNDTGNIVEEARTTIAYSPETGYTMYEVEGCPSGGTYDGATYAPAVGDGIDYDERLATWTDATDDWITNGTMTDDVKWKRCVKGGCQEHMVQADWDLLLAAYPQV